MLDNDYLTRLINKADAAMVSLHRAIMFRDMGLLRKPIGDKSVYRYHTVYAAHCGLNSEAGSANETSIAESGPV